jgi:predicted nucleic acid-binding protein
MNDRRAARAGTVLIDSAAYYALVDVGESRHEAAQHIVRRLAAQRRPALTTNFVVAETYSLIVLRLGRAVAVRFLYDIDTGATAVIRVGVEDEARAREIIRQYDDKDFSLVDAMSFAVMERLNISHAFTFDRHFAQYGFVMLDDATGV